MFVSGILVGIIATYAISGVVGLFAIAEAEMVEIREEEPLRR
jgi:hypothetical protein